MMPEVVPCEVRDLGELQCSVKGVLDILNRPASHPTARMSEDERAIRKPLSM